MTSDSVSPEEAQAALRSVDRQRLRIIEAVDVPAWYWWGLAVGWVVLGFIADLGNGWVTSAAMLAFGAIHSSVAPHVVHGRHGSDRLSVRRELVGARVSGLVLAALIALAGLTVAVSLAARADGARHPTTMASALVAVVLVLGGPRLIVLGRRRLAGAGAS